MSKIIKASRITGEYKLSDIKIEKKKDENKKYKYNDEDQMKNNENNVNDEKIVDAEKKAEEIIADAQNNAEKIIEQSKEKAEEIKEQAEKEGYDSGYQKGYDEGHKKGIEDGRNKVNDELEKKMQELNEILNEVESHFEEELERLPIEVINLSLDIASRILRKEIHVEPELINNIIFDILEEIGAAHEEIVIKVSPEMVDYINTVKIEKFLGQQSAEIVADSSLNEGDCVIETEFGGKDATIENKLDLIEKKLYQGAGYDEES